MAKVQWWQRIADPDAVVKRATAAVSDRRVRYITAARSSGLFQDEPEVLQAFVNADVPLSVANRTMAEMTKIKDVEMVHLPTGHWPMFTRPDDLARTILEAVGK